MTDAFRRAIPLAQAIQRAVERKMLMTDAFR